MYLYLYRHTVRCGQAVSVHCSNACENILNCGQHHCAELCHGGQCQPCRIILNQGKWNAHVSNAQCIFLELCAMSIILQQNFTEAYIRGKVWGMGITNKLIMRYLSMYLTKVSKMKKHVGKGIWHLHSVLTDVQNASHFGQLFVSFL